MKKKIGWIVSGLVLLCGFAITMMVPPESITTDLQRVSGELKTVSLVIHILFICVVAAGLFIRRARQVLFGAFISLISLSAVIIAAVYTIIPNFIIFSLFFVLIIHAWLTKRLNFELKNTNRLNIYFGTVALLFGFWYLHWVESPILWNALWFSPMGIINCPTMLTVCGFLCLTGEPRSRILEFMVAITTLYFGFFGVFRLGAYVDIVLIVCAVFLLIRTGNQGKGQPDIQSAGIE